VDVVTAAPPAAAEADNGGDRVERRGRGEQDRARGERWMDAERRGE